MIATEAEQLRLRPFTKLNSESKWIAQLILGVQYFIKLSTQKGEEDKRRVKTNFRVKTKYPG